MSGFKPIGPSTGSSSGGFLPVKNNTVGASGFSPYDPNTGSGSISRIFIELNGTNAYYELVTPIAMAGDFEIECLIYASIAGGSVFHGVFGGSDTSGLQRCYTLLLKDDGELLFNFGDGAAFKSMSSAAGAYTADELSLVKIKRVGDDFVMTLDGAEVSTATLTGIPATPIEYIGRYSAGTGYFNGILSDPVFNDDGTTTTFKLDEITADIEYSQENTFSSELITDGDFNIVGDWVVGAGWSISSGSATSDGSAGAVGQTISITGGTSYILEIKTSNGVYATGLTVQLGGVNVAIITSDGTHSIAVNAGGGVSAIDLFCVSLNDFIGDVDNISIKEIQGNAITYNNITVSDREQYQLSKIAPQWDNISPPVQQLPAVIELAVGSSDWIDGEAWNDSEQWLD